MRLPYLCALFSVLVLSGCYDPLEYWQRVSAPSTAYLTGAQAQALLEKDISECGASIDILRDIVVDDDAAQQFQEAALGRTPAGDPRVFRSCMEARGWQRMDPYFSPGETDERLSHYDKVPNAALCCNYGSNH
jgi:hypothetical protein